MLDPIISAKEKLDDPLMLEWALRYHNDLSENSLEEKERIASTWFHDLFIAQLIERNETETLSRLFNTLPAGHFSSFTNLIIKRWTEWPAPLANAAIHILAVNAPHALLNLLDDYLKQGVSFDFERVLNITVLTEIGIDASWQPILNRLSQKVLALPEDSFSRAFFLLSLLRLSNGLSFDVLESIVVAALRSSSEDNRSINMLKNLFQGLFGKKEYLELVLDRSKHESEQRLEPLMHIFHDGAPIDQLDQWLDTPPAFASVIPMLEERSIQSASCKTLLKLLKVSTQVKQLLPDDIRSQLTMAACIQSHARETFDNLALDLNETVALLSADFFKPYWYPALLKHLQSFKRNDVATALITHIPSVSHTYGGVQLAEIMGDLAWPEFVPCLIDSISEDQGDYLCEAAQTALKKIGKPAQTALIERWNDLDSSQRIYGLAVISDTGGQAAADFAYEQFDALMQSDMESYCELALTAPDQRLLDRLKPELRRQQPLIDRACYILARLLDHEDDKTQTARNRALANLARKAKLRKSLGSDDFFNNSLNLELRCPSCHDVNQYAVKGVIVPTDHDEQIPYLINDEFPCASCGQYVEFELTSAALITLTTEMLMMKAAHKNGKQPNSHIITMSCKIDGQTLPVATALEQLRAQIAKIPDDVRAWLQLGKILAYINRPKAAVQALSKALQLMPNAIDIKLALANAYVLDDTNEEAFRLLSDALAHVADWQFLMPQPNFGQDFAQFYNQLRRNLGREDLPALHPSSLKIPQKTGRNDPCPCGSGKKFKKCCGR